MPIINPYTNPDMSVYSPGSDVGKGLAELAKTFAQTRQLKEANLRKKRDSQILDAVLSGQEIPSRDALAEDSDGSFLSRIGDFITGGNVSPDSIGPSSLEKIMAEQAIKNKYTSDIDKLINLGKVADSEMKIYEAGGPKPSLFGEGSPSVSKPQILQSAPPEIQESFAPATPTIQSSGTNPQQSIAQPRDLAVKGYDQFGRPTGYEDVTEKNQEKREKAELVRQSAMDVLETIDEVEKGINYFGAFGAIPSLPGTDRKEWEANVNKLLAKKVIQILNDMKQASKTGATGFGQLSNKELQLLKESSTALKRTLKPEDAKKYLDRMRKIASKVLKDDPSYRKSQTMTSPYQSLWEE